MGPPQTVAVVLIGPAGELSLADALREGASDFLRRHVLFLAMRVFDACD